MSFKSLRNNIKEIIINIFEGFFCEKKNGGNKKTFSTKKYWAFVFSSLLAYHFFSLFFWPSYHWIQVFSSKGVSDIVINTNIGLLSTVGMAFISIYTYGKVKKAA